MVEHTMNTQVNSNMQELDEQIKANKQVIDMASALSRLQNNRDFRKVITEGYFKDEAVRLVMLKADPAMESLAKQESIIKQIDAIGSLHTYLNIIYQFGYTAEKQLADNEEIRAQLEQEEQAKSNGVA